MFNNDPIAICATMSAKTVNRLDDKEHFTNLTKKQKSVVKALAQYPDKGPKEISDIASESLEGDTVSRSYVHPIQDKYGHLVEEQREIQANKREQGTERTTGDPLESLEQTLNDSQDTWQGIKERPHKGNVDALTVDLSRGDVETLLQGDVPEEFRRLLVMQIVEKAFER